MDSAIRYSTKELEDFRKQLICSMASCINIYEATEPDRVVGFMLEYVDAIIDRMKSEATNAKT